jgi:hypothetical protein
MLKAFLWTFIGALVYLLGGWLKHTPKEDFNGRKALETLVIALLVSLISIAFNIPPAQALAQLELWLAAFMQFLMSTGLIALIDFWVKAVWRHRTQQL